jgi:hypothetical protein
LRLQASVVGLHNPTRVVLRKFLTFDFNADPDADLEYYIEEEKISCKKD